MEEDESARLTGFDNLPHDAARLVGVEILERPGVEVTVKRNASFIDQLFQPTGLGVTPRSHCDERGVLTLKSHYRVPSGVLDDPWTPVSRAE
jgi:hypothetical protein